MSNIKDKLFNASQKIIRAVFHGAPNLFTAPDINRQLAAFDYRFQQKEKYLPVVAKMSYRIAFSLEITYSYIELAGTVLYDGPSITIELETNVEDGWFGAGIWVKKELVTYDTDGADHLISGAVFNDGTSQSAADHYVISDWGFCYGSWTATGEPDAVEWFGVPEGAEVVAVPIVSVDPEQGGWERADNFLPPELPFMAQIQRNINKVADTAFAQSRYSVDAGTGATPYSATLNGTLTVTKNRFGVTFFFDGTFWWKPSGTISGDYTVLYRILRTSGSPQFSAEDFNQIKETVSATSLTGRGVTVCAKTYILEGGSNKDKGYIEATVMVNQGNLDLVVYRDAIGTETLDLGRAVGISFQIVFLGK